MEVKKMCCNDYKNSLHEYASGKLNELESHVLAKHLRTCDKCRSELEEIKEIKAFLNFSIQESIVPPLNLKSNIMASINLKKYKRVQKSNWGEMANWGMSLVAAGLILFFVNVSPAANIAQVHNGWGNTRVNLGEKLMQPFSSISEGIDSFTEKVTNLDGITGRIEREKKGVN
jgi:predicted anti-sigma-YlaC factor YlaD